MEPAYASPRRSGSVEVVFEIQVERKIMESSISNAVDFFLFMANKKNILSAMLMLIVFAVMYF